MSNHKPLSPAYAEREREAVLAFAMSVYTDPTASPEDREAARERLVHGPDDDAELDLSGLETEEVECLLDACERMGQLKRGDRSGSPLRLTRPEEWPLVEMLHRSSGCEMDRVNPNWIPEHEREVLNAATRRIWQLRRYKHETPPADPPLRLMKPEEAEMLDALRLTPHERKLALLATVTASDGEQPAETGPEPAHTVVAVTSVPLPLAPPQPALLVVPPEPFDVDQDDDDDDL